MKKVFGQTARNLKREVNKKVLKVAGIEQKVLDATSNEPWGSHGTHLAEIAQATHNFHEYQLIMAVIWRRINDTGKNWRHVFKALTVLEYLVAHGTERVIDEIREHAYQISTLAEFQYVDSGGRDQGINVRKKSQCLVALLNDTERIREVRQKAQANKDKYGIPSSGGSYRQSTGSYSERPDDDNYGNSADERYGYRDDERYRSRDSDERHGRDTYRDDSYSGRGNDDSQFRSRSRSVDIFPDRSFGDDDRQSSRSSGGKFDDQSQDERGLEHNLHPHNAAAPPSYEEATRNLQDIIQAERDGEAVAQSSAPAPQAISPLKSTAQGAENAVAGESVASQTNTIDTVDEFDPRGSVSALQPAASSQDLDIFGLSASDYAGPLALLPANNTTSQSDTQTNSVFGSDFCSAPSLASPPLSQPDEDPFGDAPFKAIPQENIQAQPQHLQPVTSFQPSGMMGSSETLQLAPQNAETFSTFDFGDALGGPTYAPTVVNGQHASTSPSFSTTEFPVEQSNDDILDSILPRTGSVPMFASQEAQPAARADALIAQMNPFQPAALADPVLAHGSLANTQTDQMNPFQPSGALAPVAVQGLLTHTQMAEMNPFQPIGLPASVASQEMPTNTHNLFPPSGPADSQEPTADMQTAQKNFPQQTGVPVPIASQGSPTNMQTSQMDLFQPSGSPAPTASEPITHMQTAQTNFPQPSGLSVPAASQGPQTNMQSSQTNLFQPSGTAVPVASQEPQTNMQTAQMNFFQPSRLSTSAASQGLHPNIQTDQQNILQPGALPMPAASEGSQTHMQIAQPNSVVPSGLPALTDSQGLQTHSQTTQSSFLQPSGLSTPASSQEAQSAAPPNMHGGQFGVPPNMQGGQFGALPNMQACQFGAPPNIFGALPNLQGGQFGAPGNMQAGQFGAQGNMQAGQFGVPGNMQAGHFGARGNVQAGQYGAPGNIQAGQFGAPATMQVGQFRARPNMQVGQFGALALHESQTNGQTTQTSSLQLSAQSAPVSSHAYQREASSNSQACQFGTPANLQTTHMQLGSQSMTSDPFTSQAPIVSVGLTAKPNPSKEKFETKSTVWADTLSRGLVNLDISGPKTNPLADIGVDFDAINRREKRLEPKSAAPSVTSTIVMGKAMGSGSGMGRSAAGGHAAPPNPMVGAGMGMGMGGGGSSMGIGMGMRGGPGMGMGGVMGVGGPGMGMGPGGMGMGGPGMGMGGYGRNMNQPPMGMNMGMNMGMGQGAPMQPPGQGMPGGGYNPMMGMGGYGPQNQQQYGGGYR